VTSRVSISSQGTEANGGSSAPAVSRAARLVAFASDAANLVTGDTNATTDVFVRERETNVTERVSVASDGSQGNGASLAPAVSANGRFVAFTSLASNMVPGDTNDASDVFVRDRANAVTERASVASDGTGADTDSSRFDRPALSASGRQVAFQSAADNLVADGLGAGVFVRDRRAGTTTRASGDFDGLQG